MHKSSGGFVHQRPPELWWFTTLCASELFYFGPASWWRWWFLTVVLCHLSLTVSDVEHLFMCCLAMQIPSFVRCLLKPFTTVPLPTPPPHWGACHPNHSASREVLIYRFNCIVILLLDYKSSLCVPNSSVLSVYFLNIWSHTVTCLFIYLWYWMSRKF